MLSKQVKDLCLAYWSNKEARQDQTIWLAIADALEEEGDDRSHIVRRGKSFGELHEEMMHAKFAVTTTPKPGMQIILDNWKANQHANLEAIVHDKTRFGIRCSIYGNPSSIALPIDFKIHEDKLTAVYCKGTSQEWVRIVVTYLVTESDVEFPTQSLGWLWCPPI